MKQWMMKKNPADLKKIAERYHISEILAEVLVKRGLYDWNAIDDYLYPSMDNLHTAHDIYDLDLSLDIIKEKIKRHQKIQVIGDYDVDGVMSTAILVLGLRRLGADVSWRVPHRQRDGYGLRSYMVEQAREKGIDTIITCDNGISAWDAVVRAKELAMTMIVTDHHDVPLDNDTGEERIPPADAVVDPKRKESRYPWREMCGAGLVYRLIAELYAGREDEAFLNELLSMAAVATVCDVVPLQRENRTIVSCGLEFLQHSTNKGLASLIRQLDLNRAVDSGCIGFRIGPCINAAGRLEDASTGVELMLEADQEKADKLAGELIRLNESRKDITARSTELAEKQIEEEGYLSRNVLEENKLDILRDTLNQRCTLTRKELTEKVTIDREVSLAEIDGNLVRELNYLQPVGEKNEGALFARRGLEILSVKIRGKEGQVGSFMAVDQGRCYNLVDFRIDQCMKREICEKYSEQMWLDLIDGRARDCFMDIIYIPKINERYQELQYTIVDCR